MSQMDKNTEREDRLYNRYVAAMNVAAHFLRQTRSDLSQGAAEMLVLGMVNNMAKKEDAALEELRRHD